MQSCSALAALAQAESCISLLPADAQHASMAANCTAQGVVGLSVETRKAGAGKIQRKFEKGKYGPGYFSLV